ncbi:MAG: HupE/UreJ family protein [Pseudomonadota bacterium]
MFPHSKRLAGVAAMLLACAAPGAAFAHGVSDAARERMAQGGYVDFLWLGAEHMVTGLDHLLFLLGVIFFLRRLGDVVKFVTAFTLGHALTLIGATWLGVSANPYLIDAVIALTVIYRGFENLDGFRRWFGFAAPNLVLMVFLFGLIHGFGLSARLQDLMAPHDPRMIGKILAFNLGVELGQLAALAPMAGLVALSRRTRAWEPVAKVTNTLLVAIGLLLLLAQLHAYAHAAHAESFPINRDDHAHAHVEMEIQDLTGDLGPGGVHSHDGGPPHSHDAAADHP